MKIVLGVHHYPPTFTAGVELLAERMARWHVARGHQVEVVCVETITADAPLTVRTDAQDGVVVHRLSLSLADERDPVAMRFTDDSVGRWFAAYLRSTQPDLFHSLSCYVLTASTLEAAYTLGFPTVASLHDYWYFCPRLTLLRSNGERCGMSATPTECAWCLMAESRRYRAVDTLAKRFGGDHARRLRGEGAPHKWLVDRALAGRMEQRQIALDQALRQVDQIITPAPLVRDLLVARGHAAEKIHLLQHGLDQRQFRGVPRPPRPAGLRIGYLGQIVPYKGVHVLIDAFRRLPESAATTELKIYGDMTRFPAYAAKLRHLAGGDPRIRFCDSYAHADVESVLSEIDVLVLPSLWYEILGIVILEAFQAGVPVVVSRLPNHADHVREGVDGLLYAPEDAIDLALQLRRLIEEPDLLSRLQSGIATVRAFEQEMAEVDEIYRSTLGTAATKTQRARNPRLPR